MKLSSFEIWRLKIIIIIITHTVNPEEIFQGLTVSLLSKWSHVYRWRWSMSVSTSWYIMMITMTMMMMIWKYEWKRKHWPFLKNLPVGFSLLNMEAISQINFSFQKSQKSLIGNIILFSSQKKWREQNTNEKGIQRFNCLFVLMIIIIWISVDYHWIIIIRKKCSWMEFSCQHSNFSLFWPLIVT